MKTLADALRNGAGRLAGAARRHRGRGRGVSQRRFAFLERRIARERRFKQAILLATAGAVALILSAAPWGHYVSESIVATARRTGRRVIGLPDHRAEVDAAWQRFRRVQIEQKRRQIQKFYGDCGPGHQRLLRYAGMDPAHAVLRWGNFNWTLLLSSEVFEPDDAGRSYRFRPRTRSVWLEHVDIPVFSEAPMFFLVPDGAGLAEAIAGTTARPLSGSRQTTNSWGLRGPEPDPSASLRGLVLGDSFMQGMFVGDDETPPAHLERCLQRLRPEDRVSILNAGVLGYSPEQYYWSLVAFSDRFQPHFVVVSLYPNDFGNALDVLTHGEGDWPEAKYWLEKIAAFCRERRWPLLFVPAPCKPSVLDRRTSGNYPGRLLNVLDVPSVSVLDPFDAFLNAHLEHRAAHPREEGCHLFNEAIHDEHFSAAGAEVWAGAVGERIVRLLNAAAAPERSKTPTSQAHVRGRLPVRERPPAANDQ